MNNIYMPIILLLIFASPFIVIYIDVKIRQKKKTIFEMDSHKVFIQDGWLGCDCEIFERFQKCEHIFRYGELLIGYEIKSHGCLFPIYCYDNCWGIIERFNRDSTKFGERCSVSIRMYIGKTDPFIAKLFPHEGNNGMVEIPLDCLHSELDLVQKQPKDIQTSERLLKRG